MFALPVGDLLQPVLAGTRHARLAQDPGASPHTSGHVLGVHARSSSAPDRAPAKGGGGGEGGQGKAGVRREVSAPRCSSQTPPRLVSDLSSACLAELDTSRALPPRLSSLRGRLSVGCFRTVCSPQTSHAVLPRIPPRLVFLSQRLREHFYRRLSSPGGYLCFRFTVEEGRGRALTDYQRAHNIFYCLCFDVRLSCWVG